MVDATLIHAPSSTKNEEKSRDPQMHQTRKGNQWYFGMKLHIGADTKSGLIHNATTTAANVHDSQVLPELLHGKETRVYGDSAYRGQKQAIQQAAPKAKDFTNERAQRNAPLTDAQKATVGLRQDSLPGTGQERQSLDCDVRALQRSPCGDCLGGIGAPNASKTACSQTKSLVSRGV